MRTWAGLDDPQLDAGALDRVQRTVATVLIVHSIYPQAIPSLVAEKHQLAHVLAV